MHRDPYATSHDDSIPEAYLERLHLREEIVKHVLVVEELLFYRRVYLSSTRFIHLLYVSSRAEGLASSAADQGDSGCRGRFGVPFAHALKHDMHHFHVKRVQIFGRIKLDFLHGRRVRVEHYFGLLYHMRGSECTHLKGVHDPPEFDEVLVKILMGHHLLIVTHS